MATLVLLMGLCGYAWVNILSLSPPRGSLQELMLAHRIIHAVRVVIKNIYIQMAFVLGDPNFTLHEITIKRQHL